LKFKNQDPTIKKPRGRWGEGARGRKRFKLKGKNENITLKNERKE
jgi:hypothetical protein